MGFILRFILLKPLQNCAGFVYDETPMLSIADAASEDGINNSC